MIKKFIADLFDIDLQEALKLKLRIQVLENKNLELEETIKVARLEKSELNKTVSSLEKEVLAQIKEFSNKCTHTDENLAKHYPDGLDSVSKSELYNNANNTLRLIYLQKLEYIKGLIKK